MQMRLPSLLFLSLVCIFASLQTVAADDYPSRPVKIIVPFGAGGPTDVFARAIADELQKSLKQSFVMENRPGAGSIIGTDLVAKSPPDGYMLLMISATQTVNETLNTKKSFQMLRDFVAVAPVMTSDLVLVVHPSLPVHNVAELLALARAKPGTINYASSGVGSNYHMAAELLKHLTGIDIVHVPYKGSTGARTDILGGHHRHHRQDPIEHPARCPDAGRSRRHRLRSELVDRPRRASRNTAAGGRAAQPRDQQDHHPTRHQEELGGSGRNAAVVEPE